MAGRPVAVAATSAAGPFERRATLRERVIEAEASALLVLHPPNIRYLTGFAGGGALVLGADASDALITVRMNEIQARIEVGPTLEVAVAEDRPLETARERLVTHSRVLFEEDHLPVSQYEAWKAAGGPSLEGVAGWTEALRTVKAPGERDAIARAGAIAIAAFEAVLEEVRPGVTELQLAARLETEMRARGAERFAFDTIVLFGERAALPHGEPGHRRLAPRELALFDFGAVIDGYVCDVSRTVACGSPDPRLADAYEIVRSAQRAVAEDLRGGLAAREIDALARRIVEEAGYGDRFTHSLGHGIGLEVHEDPRLWKGNEGPIAVGAVVTVEPGIYIENLGGIRIEDDYVVGRDCSQTLTGAAADEIIVL